MRVSDLVRAGGGLEDAAYATGAELTRYYIVNGERRRADLQDVDLAGVLAGNRAADVELQPYDVLTVKLEKCDSPAVTRSDAAKC